MNYEQKDETAEIAKKRANLSREYCQPFFDRFIDNYEHYFLRTIDKDVEADADSYPFYSQLMLPMTYQVVETILPRMVTKPFSFTIDTEAQNDRADEYALENLVKYHMHHPFIVTGKQIGRAHV